MTDAVSRYLKNVFEERDGPTDEYDAEESGFLENVPLFQLKVAVPRKRHKEIGNHKSLMETKGAYFDLYQTQLESAQ